MNIERDLIQATTNRKNLFLLVTLRWLAVLGQIGAIAVAYLWLDISLHIGAMAIVITCLVGLNLVTLYRYLSGALITNVELFVDLLVDVVTLTVLLYLSGGATNPFVSLFLLQAILGAVLLRSWLTWTVVAVTSACFIGLTIFYRDIGFSMPTSGNPSPKAFEIHTYGMFISYFLAAVLLVLFVTRINRNLRDQDTRLAELRQQALEEWHIVRMGLLASGAAHELGTPLATLSVILNDWERMPLVRNNGDLISELDEMKMQLSRCKTIVSGILLSSGEERGENSERASLIAFIDGVTKDWEAIRSPAAFAYKNHLQKDLVIASDLLLRQILFNVFDNALEASPNWIGVDVATRQEQLIIRVTDVGPGFSPDMLAVFGKPYHSTKQRPGSGLGLFLVVNVLRKLGGTAMAQNLPSRGAEVELSVPLSALVIEAGITEASDGQ